MTRRLAVIGTALGAALCAALLVWPEDPSAEQVNTQQPEDFRAGWAELPSPPVSARHSVALATAPQYVLLYGGIAAGGEPLQARDGGLFKIDAQTWEKVPPAPRTLVATAATWDPSADRFVVAGVACLEPDSDSLDCPADGIRGLSYSPSTREWTELSATLDRAAPVVALGVVNDRPTFWHPADPFGRWTSGYFAVDETGSFVNLPSPPIRESVQPCAAAGNVVAVSITYVDDEGRELETLEGSDISGFAQPAHGASRIEAAVLSASGEWSHPVGFSDPASLGLPNGSMTCGVDSALLPSAGGFGLFDVAGQEWRSVPPPPSARALQLVSSTIAYTGEEYIMWGSSDEAWRLHAQSSRWIPARPGPVDAAVAMAPRNDRVFSYTTGDGTGTSDSHWFTYAPPARGEAEQAYPFPRNTRPGG